MRVARTGAKKGHSPTWYVAAETLEEQQAMLAGFLVDRSPDSGYRFVVIWGLGSKAAAVKALEGLQEEVAEAVGRWKAAGLAGVRARPGGGSGIVTMRK